MNVKETLKNLNFKIDKKESSYLKKEIDRFSNLLEKEINKNKIRADVFVGGSFSKGTLAKDDKYDADIFVRFDKKYNELSDLLEKVVKSTAKNMKISVNRLHGSRDYFRIQRGKLTFEIIPILKISKVNEARNVTDLSYFHVNYVKRNLNDKMKNEVLLAKKFCKAQRIYGAESYVNGFSGYGLECLIIYYKTFEKMLIELTKAKEKIVIDPAKHYKRKEDIFIELNESKTKGPMILVDPTFRERNVLAALNSETFKKFQTAVKKFLKNPSKKLFDLEEIDIKKMKKKGEFVHVILKTDRQGGDIAGTKMKKFSNFLAKNLEKYFDIIEKEFEYSGAKESNFYLAVKSKGEIIRRGPYSKDEKHALAFRKKNKKVFEKKGILYAKDKVDFSAKEFLTRLKKNMREMGIIEMKI